MSITWGAARDAYANRAQVRSAHTLQAYLRAIDLFLQCLDDRQFTPRLPLQNLLGASASELEINRLSGEDEMILQHFVHWLQSPGEEGDKRPYSRATVELRLAGVQRWLEFIEAQGWLPEDFSLFKAVRQLKQTTPAEMAEKPTKAVEIIFDLTDLVNFYDGQNPPKRIQKNAEQMERWELTRLRNRALIKMLAETGGQISAILSINLSVMEQASERLILPVVGKNEHSYELHVHEALPALRDYLRKRQIPEGKAADTPVFISHDTHYQGHRMSRIIAWRIIQRAAKAVGLPEVSPHDLRHWRAQQLIAAGASLEEVKERLGHRSLHTVKTYYGHLVDKS